MLEYRRNKDEFQIWSTSVDSLSVRLDVSGIFEKYANGGFSWKTAMEEYIGELYVEFLRRFYREISAGVMLTARRLAYCVIEEKRFDKKYSPESPISEFLSDYETGVKAHRGEKEYFWNESSGKYTE